MLLIVNGRIASIVMNVWMIGIVLMVKRVNTRIGVIRGPKGECSVNVVICVVIVGLRFGDGIMMFGRD